MVPAGMRLGVAGLAALVLAITAQAAVGRNREHAEPAAFSRKFGAVYTRCAVRENRQAVVAYLASPVGTPESDQKAAALSSLCLLPLDHEPIGQGRLTMSNLLLRGTLFEALYYRDFRKLKTLPSLQGAAPQDYAVVGTDPAGQTERRDYRAFMKIGDCAVRAAPEQVRDWNDLIDRLDATKVEVAPAKKPRKR